MKLLEKRLLFFQIDRCSFPNKKFAPVLCWKKYCIPLSLNFLMIPESKKLKKHLHRRPWRTRTIHGYVFQHIRQLKKHKLSMTIHGYKWRIGVYIHDCKLLSIKSADPDHFCQGPQLRHGPTEALVEILVLLKNVKVIQKTGTNQKWRGVSPFLPFGIVSNPVVWSNQLRVLGVLKILRMPCPLPPASWTNIHSIAQQNPNTNLQEIMRWI